MAKTLRQEHTEHTRLALLSAATELFAECGYDETSIDDIVTRARVTRGALYHHFASKQEIFQAVCDAADNRVVERVRDSASAPGTAAERMLRALDTYLAESKDPTYRAIVLREAYKAHVRDEGIRYTPAMAALITQLLEELQREGALEVAEPELLSRMLCATLCEAASTIEADATAASEEFAKAAICRMIFGGQPQPTG